MLRYRKNLAIIAAISLALNLQGVGAVADEASSSGTVGNGKFTVTSSKIKAGQEHNYNVVIVAPTQGQGAVPAGQGVPGRQNAPDNGQQAAPEEAEGGAIAGILRCSLQPAL